MTTEPQWSPTPQDVTAARISDFARFAGRAGADYRQLWQWSVDQLDEFWGRLWDYFDLGPRPDSVLATAAMPGAQWFPGVQLNYVDQVVRQATPERPAIRHVEEGGVVRDVSWAELLRQAGAFAHTLTELGVRRGDRVVGYLPNIPETVAAFLAVASIGAVWSACGQDYSAAAALTRLGQLDPVVLVTARGYRFAGKFHDRTDDIATLQQRLPSLRKTIVVESDWAEVTAGTHSLEPVRVPFDQPLWVLYSSGTTGPPKGIVHGHGGVLLEHLKAVALHTDLRETDTFFWYTSPSWMMWNYQIAGLLVGATIVTYPGSPGHPAPDSLWRIASDLGVTVLGTSPAYVLACIKAGVRPERGALRTVGITGSTLPPSSSLWLRDQLGVQVSSISGGTDVVSAFVGGTRTVPVWPGELSAPYLGVALDAFDEAGQSVRGMVGELVITAPMPSMPVSFWNDPDGTRYRDAYFTAYPGVWRHGDWITITEHGSVEVHGRSDSTLNRKGIRMGSADIYQIVERLPEVAEALVLGIERPDGEYWMPLFIVLAPGAELDDELLHRIRTALRTEASPHHVPDDIIAAPAVPHTRTGKKLEVPLKRILQGADPSRVVDRSAIDAPDLIDWYAAVERY